MTVQAWACGSVRCASSSQASSSGRFGGRGSDSDEQDRTIDFGFRQVPRGSKEHLVGEVFRSVASNYDVMNDFMSGGLHRVWKDRLVQKLRPFPSMQHVDVAGGTGDVAFRILRAMRESRGGRRGQEADATAAAFGSGIAAPRPARGSVTVVDINGSMLAEGRRRAVAQGLDPVDLEWVEASAEKLPLADASQDSYTVSFGIRNVTDRAAALREAHRVLRPGGRFLCLEFSKVEESIPGLQQIYDAYSFHVIPAIGKLVAGDQDSYQYLVESIRMFPDQETWAQQIEDAGFKGVEYENLSFGVVAIHSGLKL
ncbi:ubiE/COQ5 methyltransferase [Helicosporidium sp. ATCC 50920]|nr:ubiE/COQ5 methyltransferase [Helicosporidium sp. ATCC 50920]|eukprot:KDD75057.1 ubiE/COQ5 methyltransferase [Helicosporidium sp. ATCC 50920]